MRVLSYLISLTAVAYGAGILRRFVYNFEDKWIGSFPWQDADSLIKLACYSVVPIALILAAKKGEKFTLAGKLGSSICGLFSGGLAPISYLNLMNNLPPGAIYRPMTAMDFIVPPAMGFGIVWTAMELSDALPNWLAKSRRSKGSERKPTSKVIDLD